MSYDGGHEIIIVNDVLYQLLKKFEQGAESYEISRKFWRSFGFGKPYKNELCVINDYCGDCTDIDDCPHCIEDVFPQIKDIMYRRCQDGDYNTDERFVKEMLQYLSENEEQINTGYEYVKWEYYYPDMVGNGSESFVYKNGKSEYHQEGEKHSFGGNSNKVDYLALENLRIKNLRAEYRIRKKKTNLQNKKAEDALTASPDMIHIEFDGIWIDVKADIVKGRIMVNGHDLNEYVFVLPHDQKYYYIDVSKLEISKELKQYNNSVFAYTEKKDETLILLKPLPEALRVLWAFIARYGAVKNEFKEDLLEIYKKYEEQKVKAGWHRLPSNDPEYMEAKKTAVSFFSAEETVSIFFDFINQITTMGTSVIETGIQELPKRKDGLMIKNRVSPACDLGLRIIDHEYTVFPVISYEFKSLSNTEFTSRLILPYTVDYAEEEKLVQYKLIKDIISGSDKPKQPKRNSYGKDFVVKNNVLKKYKGNAEVVIIPDGIEEIGAYAFVEQKPYFRPNNVIKRIELPDSVVRIDDLAFNSCNELESIRFSKNLTEIGRHAICDCGKLQSLDLSDTKIEEINQSPIGFCSSLSSIVLPKNLRVLKYLEIDKMLEKMVIPKSIESIGVLHRIKNLYFEGTEIIDLRFISELTWDNSLTVHCKKNSALWDELIKKQKKLKNAFELVEI